MPKLITTKRQEGHAEKARLYVKTYILFPSALLALIFLVAGTASLVHQLMATDTYSAGTFWQSTGLIALGGLLGWIQTRYHRYILRRHPAVFAARLGSFSRTRPGRSKNAPVLTPDALPAARFVPLAYLAGMGGIVAASTLSAMAGEVYYVAAYLLPWAGFFWARLFFWRGVLQETDVKR